MLQVSLIFDLPWWLYEKNILGPTMRKKKKKKDGNTLRQVALTFFPVRQNPTWPAQKKRKHSMNNRSNDDANNALFVNFESKPYWCKLVINPWTKCTYTTGKLHQEWERDIIVYLWCKVNTTTSYLVSTMWLNKGRKVYNKTVQLEKILLILTSFNFYHLLLTWWCSFLSCAMI